MQVFYPTEFHISTADSHEISSSNVQLNLQLQIIKSQQDNQEKGLASLNSKLESAGYAVAIQMNELASQTAVKDTGLFSNVASSLVFSLLIEGQHNNLINNWR